MKEFNQIIKDRAPLIKNSLIGKNEMNSPEKSDMPQEKEAKSD
jgi:hypothetical protein